MNYPIIYNGVYQKNWSISTGDFKNYLEIFKTSYDYNKILDAFGKLTGHIPMFYLNEVSKLAKAEDSQSPDSFHLSCMIKDNLLNMFENSFIPAVNLRLKNEQRKDGNSELKDLLAKLDTLCNSSPYRSSSNLKLFEEVKYEHFYFLFLKELLRRTNKKAPNNENNETFHNELDLLSKKLVIYLEPEKYQNYLLRLVELCEKGEVPNELNTNLQSVCKK